VGRAVTATCYNPHIQTGRVTASRSCFEKLDVGLLTVNRLAG